MKSPMLIFAVVDDAGLSPVEFRVLAHICRRAGENECWASVRTISEKCKINQKTTRAAVHRLEKMGWVSIQKRTGQTSVLIPNTPSNPIPLPNEYPTQLDTLPPSQLDTLPPSQLDTPKGNPIRTPKKEPQKVVVALPFSSPEFIECWNLWLDHRKSLKKPSTPQSQKMTLNKLSKMSEQTAIDAIRHSVENNWQSIYPPKPNSSTIRPISEPFSFQKNGHKTRPFD
jgi:hypothetical protein